MQSESSEEHRGDFLDAAESLKIKDLGSGNHQKTSPKNTGNEVAHVQRRKDRTSPLSCKRMRLKDLGQEETCLSLSCTTNSQTLLPASVCSEIKNLGTTEPVSFVKSPFTQCEEQYTEAVVVKNELKSLTEINIQEMECYIEPKEEEIAEDVELAGEEETNRELAKNRYPDENVDAPSLCQDETSPSLSSTTKNETLFPFSVCGEMKNLETVPVPFVKSPSTENEEVLPEAVVKNELESLTEVYIQENECYIEPKEEDIAEDVGLEGAEEESTREFATNQIAENVKLEGEGDETKREFATNQIAENVKLEGEGEETKWGLATNLFPDEDVDAPNSLQDETSVPLSHNETLFSFSVCGEMKSSETTEPMSFVKSPFTECEDVLPESVVEKNELEPMAEVYIEETGFHIEPEGEEEIELQGASKEMSREIETNNFPGVISASASASLGRPLPTATTVPSVDSSRRQGGLNAPEAVSGPPGRGGPPLPASASCEQSSVRKKKQQRRHCCPECGKAFSTGSEVKRHRRVHTGERPFRCSECGKSFTQSTHLTEHTCVHAAERPYLCAHCGRGFTRKHSLKKHMSLHTGERSFRCSECGKSFSQSNILTVHMRLHSGERPFHCTLCGKDFIESGKLVLHMQEHTGERPFPCADCGKGFKTSTHLNRHMRAHTGERPFGCTLCGKQFTERGKLTSHMRVHTGERPYCCDDCGKGFKTSTHLNIHMRVHTGERPFDCAQCGKCFSVKSNLEKHTRLHTE